MKENDILLRIPQTVFLLCSITTAIATILFVGFIFYTAYPVFAREGLGFITGSVWDYGNNIYGIRIFIAGTLILTVVTLILALPVSIFTAIFLSEFAHPRVAAIVRPLVELLVGIPSVVYGIFGLFVLHKTFRDHVNPLIDSILGFIPIFANTSPSTATGVLLASVVLAIMILPTIVALSEDALRSVPPEYREASYSVGATQWETIRKVVIPAASGGIMGSVILGTMRAMGETMAIVMLMGNTQKIPTSILDTGYAMTSKILNEIGYYVAVDEARSALFGIAAVLFAVEMMFVALARKIGGRV
ncbi:phosphate ABC transporter permease subunit PstC [Methanolobus sp. WCC5]|uniref:phosphate ABC transporter permease subunit PstC n=1 Tax=Methanolobus sp. WCC5 TaxID=3125785 RepID=UPI00324A7088